MCALPQLSIGAAVTSPAAPSILRTLCARPATCPQVPTECKAYKATSNSGASAINLDDVGGLFVIHVGFLVLSLLVFARSRCVNGCMLCEV